MPILFTKCEQIVFQPEEKGTEVLFAPQYQWYYANKLSEGPSDSGVRYGVWGERKFVGIPKNGYLTWILDLFEREYPNQEVKASINNTASGEVFDGVVYAVEPPEGEGNSGVVIFELFSRKY